MSKAILGRKLGMTQIFTEEGTVVPVTVVESGNNVVIMNKTVENDGYNAVQIGFGEVKEKRVTKPLKGHFAKAGVAPVRFIREMRLTDASEYNVGDTIGVDIFAAGDLVDVTGTSKGKGFAGTIKRHNFHRQRKTHGGKGNTRKIGSIGSMYPQRIWKGHPMAGQMGGEQVTVKNLSVAYIDSAKNLIGVKGAVPGPKKGIVVISSAKQFGHGKEAK